MLCTWGVEKCRFSGLFNASSNHGCPLTSNPSLRVDTGVALTRLPSLRKRAKLIRLSLLASYRRAISLSRLSLARSLSFMAP